MQIPFWLFPYLVPLVFFASAFFQLAFCKTDEGRWQVAQVGSVSALAISLSQMPFLPNSMETAARLMMILVAFIAAVLCFFSRTYLVGMRHQMRFVSAFLLTLGSVCTLISTDHLGVLVLAWFATGMFLHRLLTFFEDRSFALLAARKKIFVDRLAELCLVGFLIVIFEEFGTVSISALVGMLSEANTLSPSVHFAGALLALAVVFKTAQFPLHGWILQVMEAPTPVSALLHAGVVNMGGLVLIRMASLVSAVPAAQVILVAFGTVTAVVASLVALTRISIKVRLAWSTCAQMGFMLIECGLGFYNLALVHLIAHSLYKAYAFLSCGETVRKTLGMQMAPKAQRHSRTSIFAAAAVGVCLVFAAAFAYGSFRGHAEFHFGFLLISGLAVSPLLRGAFGAPSGVTLVSLFQAVAVLGATVFWHFETSPLAFSAIAHPALQSALISIVGLSFLLLFSVQSEILARPQGRLASALYPYFYGGFFVDDLFTRFVMRQGVAQSSAQTDEQNMSPVLPSVAYTGER